MNVRGWELFKDVLDRNIALGDFKREFYVSNGCPTIYPDLRDQI
jgi:hypothetical protein